MSSDQIEHIQREDYPYIGNYLFSDILILALCFRAMIFAWIVRWNTTDISIEPVIDKIYLSEMRRMW